MAMKDKLHTGELYLPGDEEIMRDQLKRLDRLYDFNQTRPTELDKRQKLMKEMFAEIGEGCYIEPPFYSNMGGGHVHFGKNIYCNFGVTMVDIVRHLLFLNAMAKKRCLKFEKMIEEH